MPVGELLKEIVSDVTGKILLDFLREKKLKLDQGAIIDIVLADSVFVYFIKEMLRKNQGMLQMELMDVIGKYVSRVVVKMAQGKKLNYVNLAIDVAVGEAGSLVVEQLFPALL